MEQLIQSIINFFKSIETRFLSIENRIKTKHNYYVDEMGSDLTGDGSKCNPWQTLNYACEKVKEPNSCIRLRPGIYYITKQINLSPGVSIRGYGKSSIISSNVTSPNGVIFAYSESEGTIGNQVISKLKFDGQNCTARGCIMIKSRSNVIIHSCTFKDFQYYGVAYQGNLTGKMPVIFAKGNRFYNNLVVNCAGFYTTGYAGGLLINGQDGMLVYNNKMIQDYRPGNLNGVLIRGISGYDKNLKIHHNKLFTSPLGKYDFSIEMWNCLGNIEISNNKITGSVDMGGGNNVKGESNYSYWIHHNEIGPDTLGNLERTRGIEIEHAGSESSDIIIEKNKIKNVAMGVLFASTKSGAIFKNIQISYNIFKNIGISEAIDYKGWGVIWSTTYRNLIIDNIEIINNIFSGHKGTHKTMWGVQLPDNGKATNINVKNNIIENFSYGAVYANGLSGESIENLSIENNCLWNNGYNNQPRIKIKLINEKIQNNIIADPLFKSEDDLHLQETSPCKKAGVNVGLTEDYAGNIINQPSIGVYN